MQSIAHAYGNQPVLQGHVKESQSSFPYLISPFCSNQHTIWCVSFLTFLSAHTDTWTFPFTHKIFLLSRVLCTGY